MDELQILGRIVNYVKNIIELSEELRSPPKGPSA